MVLIFAAETDALATGVAAELARRGCDHLWLGPDWLARCTLAWRPHPFEGHIAADGRRVDLAEVSGVLARATHVIPNPLTAPTDDELYVQAETNAMLLGLFDRMPCPVVNPLRPTPYSRPLLIGGGAARRAGLTPAPCVITSEREVALDAWRNAGAEGAVLGRPSGSWADQLITDEARAGEALDSLLPDGAVVVRPVLDVEPLLVFVAGDQVVGARAASWPPHPAALRSEAITPKVRSAARALAQDLDVGLLQLSLAEGDEELWAIDVDPSPVLVNLPPGILDEVSGGIADRLVAAPGR